MGGLDLKMILAIAIAVVMILAIIKFVTKVIVKVIGVAVILVVGGYFLLFFNGGLLNVGNERFILDDLQAKMCTSDPMSPKCDCIINTLQADIYGTYSKTELEKLQKNKLRSLKVIVQSLNRNKANIQHCLKERKALDVWYEFIDDLKSNDKDKKMMHSFDDLQQ